MNEIQPEIKKLKRELTLLPVFGLIYFTVCGGAFGVEPLVGFSGPGLALLLIALTPFIFSLPNMLMVRELNSMMPVEGGYYHWVKQAFGPFAGFLAGWNNWVVSWLDVSIYPVLAATYLGYFIPALDNGTVFLGVALSPDFLRWLVSAVLILAISWLQIRGAKLSAMFTNVLGIAMIIPLVVMSVFGAIAWAKTGAPVDLPLIPEGETLFGALSVGLFVVMWNYMGWELPAVAGDEIVDPKKTYPRAMALVLVAAIATYALPVATGLMGGAGAEGRWKLWGNEAVHETVGIASSLLDPAELERALPLASEQNGVGEEDVTLDMLAAVSPAAGAARENLQRWNVNPADTTGWEFPQIGDAIGRQLGNPGLARSLGVALMISAVLSMIGLFIGNSLGGSRIPFALAEDGMFPRFLVRVHPRYGTPWVAITFVGFIYLIFSWSAFEFLVVADVFLQSLVILAEFGALWVLRRKFPRMERQRVPGGLAGLVLVTLGPVAIILLAIASQYLESGFASIGWALLLMAVGAVLYLPFRRRYKPGVPDVNPFAEGSESA